MKRLINLSNTEARDHFLKGSSYFNNDFPGYISFEPILKDVANVLNGGSYTEFQSDNDKPENFSDVNYILLSNKDGKFAWRQFELIHPAIYISLVNTLCESDNWKKIQDRFKKYESGIVESCSAPVMSLDNESDTAKQIISWWKRIEQRSIEYSLRFSHILHTDVTDCYGSLYTHSIAWAIHGKKEAKEKRRDSSLLGNKIDSHIRVSRNGQTNGISQGSILMDFIAEIVLGYVDEQISTIISSSIGQNRNYRILRYRDDYRIFADSDELIEEILKIISCELRDVGMRLNISKTFINLNVIEGSIKEDKLAGIELQDLGKEHAQSIQKQLLRLHRFCTRFPNSGALQKLVSDYHTEIVKITDCPEDLEVQVAIATDIGFISPRSFPAIAAILSHLISLSANEKEKLDLWDKVRNKMARVPNNGYLEIWLQRVVQPKSVGFEFKSSEAICRIVNGETPDLWENSWISSHNLKNALDVSKIIVASVSDYEEVVQPEEIELFKKNALIY